MMATCRVWAISPEDLHRLQYQCVVNYEGKHVLEKVFHWSYKGGTLSIKDFLFSRLGLSNVQYRSRFSAHQRAKLNGGDPVGTFDITLLYSILRHTCDIDLDDGASDVQNPPTLSNLIYKVKQHRNNLAHEDQHMTQQDMEDRVKELRLLFLKIIELAGERFSRPDLEVESIKSTINDNLDRACKKICDPFGPADVMQYQDKIKELKDQLKSNIQLVSVKELQLLYSQLCEVNLLPYLFENCQVNPTQIFTKFLLVEDGSRTLEGEQKRKIPHTDILDIKRTDGKIPNVFILSAEGGMGKTTYLKYLTETWAKGSSSVVGLEQVEVLLYVECRNPTISTVDQLIKSLLHGSYRKLNVEYEHMRETVLHMQVLVLVDGFDEVSEASKNLILELLHLPRENIRLLFTTRPGSLPVLTRLLPGTSRIIIFGLEGISQEQHLEFVGKLCDSFVEPDRKEEIVKVLEEQLSNMIEYLGAHLNCPLNLTLLTMLTIKDQKMLKDLTSPTSLYVMMMELLSEKLKERLSPKLLKTDMEEVDYKCSLITEYIDSISFRAMKRREYELLPDTMKDLRNKCQELGLPHHEVLSTFFTTRLSRENSVKVLCVSYPHLRIQEFFTARHLHTNLTQSLNKGEVLKGLLSDEEEWKSERRFHNVAVHVTGLLVHMGQMTAKYAAHLLSLAPISSTSINPILAHVVEARTDVHVVEAATRRLQNHTEKWDGWVQAQGGPQTLHAFSVVLNKVSSGLETVTLSANILDLEHPSLVAAIETISQKNTKLAIDFSTLYFSNHDESISEKTLALLNSPAKCSLQAFRGRIAPSALHILPCTLTELRLRIDTEGLQALNAVLPNLMSLDILGVKYEKTSGRGDVPALAFTGRQFSLTLPGVTINDIINWAANLMATLCSGRTSKDYTKIFLPSTDLDYNGVEELMLQLNKRSITVTERLDIQTSTYIGKEGMDNLNNLATKLNLGNFIRHQKS